MDRVHYVNLKSPGTYKRILRAIISRPAIIGVLARLFVGHLKSPWLIAKFVTAAPRGLYFGDLARELGPDHLHAHFITSPTTVALIASKVSGVPFSATAHAFDITSQDPRHINGSPAYKMSEAAAVVTISEYNRRDILSRWPELDGIQLDVIYNGIDTSMFESADGHVPLGSLDETVRILCVSTLAEKKGFPILFKAVAELVQRGRDVQLDAYGGGPEQQNLEALLDELNVGPAITMHGPATQDVVRAECARADIYALASVMLPSEDADGLPTVLIESLAMELPTVSTQVTGIPEIIVDGETGRCVPDWDHIAFADALEWMMDNREEARMMGKAGRQLVLETFDRKVSSAALIETWATANPAVRAKL